MPAFYLEFDKQNDELGGSFESSSLSRCSKDLGKITKRLKIKSIFELFSYANQNDLCPPEYQETEVPWFAGQEGIDWLEAVIEQIQKKPSCVKKPDKVLADLSECQKVLQKAKKAGANWHFLMDI